jgi:hypothetical protein
MSGLLEDIHDVAKRRPDVFTVREREQLAADAEFKKLKAEIDSRAQGAENAKRKAPRRRLLAVAGDNQGPVSIPITRRPSP